MSLPAAVETTAFINTLVGPGSAFKGDIRVQGFCRVDGDVHGTIEADGRVLVGPSGRVKGNISGRDIVIGGVVKGDLYATERITLLSTALVVGHVYAPRVRIEKGVLLEGSCCAAPRIREEGVHPLQTQRPYTLKFSSRPQLPQPAAHG